MGKMNRNGVCHSLKPGDERFEYFTVKMGFRTVGRYQYDYRCDNGDLFSVVGKTVEACRSARNEWLKTHAITCPDCHGTGADEVFGNTLETEDTVVEIRICRSCNGTGEVMEVK